MSIMGSLIHPFDSLPKVFPPLLPSCKKEGEREWESSISWQQSCAVLVCSSRPVSAMLQLDHHWFTQHMVSIGRSAYGEPALLFELTDPWIASETWSHWAAVVAVSLMPLARRHEDLVPAGLVHGGKQKQISFSIPCYSSLLKYYHFELRRVGKSHFSSFTLSGNPDWDLHISPFRVDCRFLPEQIIWRTSESHLVAVTATLQRSPDRPLEAASFPPCKLRWDCKVQLITSELPWGRRKIPEWRKVDFHFP